MRLFLALIGFILVIYSCGSGKTALKGDTNSKILKNDTIRIANPELEYEIIIIEPGFDSWIVTQPPKGYYGLNFLENRNHFYVLEYNRRVLDLNYSRQLYPQNIEYDPNIHYGLEVNYLLYNYFKFFEKEYKQKL